MLMHANRMPRLPGPSLLHAVRDDCASYSELDFGHHLRLVHPPPPSLGGAQWALSALLGGVSRWDRSLSRVDPRPSVCDHRACLCRLTGLTGRSERTSLSG